MKKLRSLNESDIKSGSIKENGKLNTVKNGMSSVVLALAVGGASLTMTGCADDKSCSDYDVSSTADGNGSTAYDTGTWADSYDYGGDTDTNSYGDSPGNGDICRDYD